MSHTTDKFHPDTKCTRLRKRLEILVVLPKWKPSVIILDTEYYHTRNRWNNTVLCVQHVTRAQQSRILYTSIQTRSLTGARPLYSLARLVENRRARRSVVTPARRGLQASKNPPPSATRDRTQHVLYSRGLTAMSVVCHSDVRPLDATDPFQMTRRLVRLAVRAANGPHRRLARWRLRATAPGDAQAVDGAMRSFPASQVRARVDAWKRSRGQREKRRGREKRSLRIRRRAFVPTGFRKSRDSDATKSRLKKMRFSRVSFGPEY